jgi:hypothetical protein
MVFSGLTNYVGEHVECLFLSSMRKIYIKIYVLSVIFNLNS